MMKSMTLECTIGEFVLSALLHDCLKRTVATGGYLFEQFCVLYGTDAQHDEIQSLKATALNGFVIQQHRKPLFETQHKRFYFHIYAALSSMGRGVQHQRFLLTFYLNCKGTSNSGLATLAQSGLVLARTTFRRQLKQAIEAHDEEIRWVQVNRALIQSRQRRWNNVVTNRLVLAQ